MKEKKDPTRFLAVLLLVALWLIPSAVAGPTITLANGHRYELKEKLGEGTYGEVYDAIDLRSGKPVAVKILVGSEEFHDEASAPFSELYSSQARDHVVRVTDVGRVIESNGLGVVSGAFVMEKVEGTLDEESNLLRIGDAEGRPLALRGDDLSKRAERLREITFQMMKIWGGLAEKGLFFGDVKPGNLGVVRSPSGEIQLKLLDLGSVNKGPLDASSRSYNVYSTQGYRAPELKAFYREIWKDSLSSYTDLYAFGLSLLEVLCNGCPPEELPLLIERWNRKLPDNEETRRALANLTFLEDFISAATRSRPSDRYSFLRKPPLSRFVRFHDSLSGEGEPYLRAKPEIIAASFEVEKVYLPWVEHRQTALPEKSTSWFLRTSYSCRRAFRRLVHHLGWESN